MHKWLINKGVHNVAALSGLAPVVLNTWLMEAAQQGELKVIDRLIQSGATLNFQDMAGYTALSVVVDAEQEDIELVESLVIKGAGIHHFHRDGNTLLHCAAERGYLTIAKFLVENSIKVEDVNNEGQTALHVAAKHGEVGIVKFLLGVGVNPNAKCKQLWTPLHYAAYAGHTQTVTILKGCGARDWIINNQRQTALDLARRQGYMETVEVLGGAGSGKVVECHSYVARAVGDALRAKRYSRGPALHSGVIMSVESNNLKRLCALIGEGAVIDLDALHIAAYKGFLKIAMALILFGVDVTARDEQGKTALHIAAKQGGYEMVTVLLEVQAPVNCTDNHNRTPLHEAAASGHTKKVALLLQKGAESWCLTAEGETAYDLAVRYRRTETAAFLKNYNMPLVEHSMPILYRETTLATVVAKMDAPSSSEPNILKYNPEA